MQSEKFDKRTREAAENHHPAYDEQAWNKMEKLLDKHLPQKEDKKRRILFILLLFLLLGSSGVWLFNTKLWNNSSTRQEKLGLQESKQVSHDKSEKAHREKDHPINPATGKLTDQQAVNTNDEVLQEKAQAHNKEIVSSGTGNRVPYYKETGRVQEHAQFIPYNDHSTLDGNKKHRLPYRDNDRLGNKTKIGPAENNSSNYDSRNKEKSRVTDPARKNKSHTEENLSRQMKPEDKVTGGQTGSSEDRKQDPSIGVDKKASVAKEGEETAGAKNNTVEATSRSDNDTAVKKDIVAKSTPSGEKKEDSISAATKKSASLKKNNSLVLTVSAGPDVSVVSGNAMGKTRMVTGLGLSYTIKDRFTISTGFYSARKIYSAQPSDYKAPPEFYQFYPFLEKVDANCRVYEIPVSVAYNFGKKGNHSWFVSAGLSTFLMNEEGYNYFYKYTPTGNTYTNYWKVKNENAHYFSVGTLSAGYKHQLGKRFTLMAEPYVKVPFSGVGYGKVKLNSGGVLFTVGMKIF